LNRNSGGTVEHETAYFDVEVALLPTEVGGRSGPISTGYRPNHKDPLGGEFFMGSFTFENNTSLAPGQVKRARLHVIAMLSQIAAIRAFGSWTFWEGPTRHVGSVRVLGETAV
jgi:hypothetical protein